MWYSFSKLLTLGRKFAARSLWNILRYVLDQCVSFLFVDAKVGCESVCAWMISWQRLVSLSKNVPVSQANKPLFEKISDFQSTRTVWNKISGEALLRPQLIIRSILPLERFYPGNPEGFKPFCRVYLPDHKNVDEREINRDRDTFFFIDIELNELWLMKMC